MDYVQSLRFEDKPDYNYLKKIFRVLFMNEEFELDYIYDWALPPQVF